MLRAVIISGLVVALALAVIVGSGGLPTGSDANNESRGASLPVCDLLAGPCEWETESGRWHVDLKPITDQGQGIEYQLTVQTPIAQERLLAVLRGESMYMGEYPVPLRGSDGTGYSAHFTAPLCTTGSEMIWRVDFQKGQQPLAETVPLKLIFQSQKH